MIKHVIKPFIIFVVVTLCTFSYSNADASNLKSSKIRYTENSTKQKNISKNQKLSKKKQKQLDKLIRKYKIDTITRSQAYYDSLKLANPFKYVVDYMSKDAESFQKMNLDSLSRSFFTDTLTVSGGIVKEFNSLEAVSNVRKLDSLITAKKLIDKRIQRIMGVRKDTLSLTTVSLTSIVVPGFAQIINKDYWKLPILYGGTGGFIGLGVWANSRSKTAKAAYQNAITDKLPQEEINILQKKYNSINNEKLAYFAGAIITYVYFLADGIYNFEGKTKAPAKAALLGLFIPGGGQIYNKSYWKLPIYYGGLVALGYVISYNANGYNRYSKAYDIVTDDNPDTVDEFDGQFTADQLSQFKSNFRRSRDLAIFFACGFYLLGIVEAYVDASFKSYDISDNLAFKIVPTIGQMGTFNPKSNNLWDNSMLGVSINFSIKNR